MQDHVHWTIESFMNFVYKKIKHIVLFQMIQYNSLHMFFEKKKTQISWFQLTFKILGFAISHQFKMNDINFA